MAEQTPPKAPPKDQKPEQAEPKGSNADLLAAAQKQAPHVDQAFVDQHGLDDEYLQGLADGLIPPPPYNGPNPTTDLHRTPGGWQLTPKGVHPRDVGKAAISR